MRDFHKKLVFTLTFILAISGFTLFVEPTSSALTDSANSKISINAANTWTAQNVRVGNVTTNTVNFSWDYPEVTYPGEDFVDFFVECYSDAAMTQAVEGCGGYAIDGSSKNFSESGLQPGTTYYFKIISFMTYQNAPNAYASIAITTLTQVEAFAASYNSITVSWLPIDNVTNYTLQYSTSSNFSSGVTSVPTTNTKLTIPATANTTYYFRTAPAGTTNWSPVSQAKTPTAAQTHTVYRNEIEYHGISMDSNKYIWAPNYIQGHLRRVNTSNNTVQTIASFRANSIRQSAVYSTSKVFLAVNEPGTTSTEGIYEVSSTGVKTLRIAAVSAYGVAYDGKNLFYTDNTKLYKCPYVATGALNCSLVYTASSGLGYLSIAPGGDNLVFGGANGPALTALKISTGNIVNLIDTTGLDIRGVLALSDTSYLLASWNSNKVWQVKLNSNGSVTSTLIIDGLNNPRGMVYDSSIKKLYVAATKRKDGSTTEVVESYDLSKTGLFQYVNLVN